MKLDTMLLDKSARLKSIDGSKIVLIGDSNVSFGFQSELIEQAYGIPVVNMGLHGGLGNAFHEEMAKINVHEGDIYVICHHTFADNGKIDDTELAWITLEITLISGIFHLPRIFPVWQRHCLLT